MTCAHVLGLIDAGPFADYPRPHLDAAWQHARQCATCGPALEAATALTADLAALPQPAVPPDLAAAVLSRIARIDHSDTAAVAATQNWPGWAIAFGGVGAGLVIVMTRAATGAGAAKDIASETASALALAVSLALYVVGLFAPLGANSGESTTD